MSVLGKFIQAMQETDYEKQKQLPNPTVIESNELLPRDHGKKAVVFTAYLKEQFIHSEWEQHKDDEEMSNEVSECWYPSVFFFDLDEKRTLWEVFGCDQFIKVFKKKSYVLTNEFWQRITEE